ncbi:MAG: ComEC/Rec2 family competence protein [Phycisphaera sp.]|nr:MAG: ComEC/Rec2 family competence protein [Phycisphaera sp.]
MPTLPDAQPAPQPATSPARTRALLAFSAGLGGVLLARFAGLEHPTLLYALAIALSGVSLAIPRHAGRAVLLVAIACVGAGRMAGELAPPADHLVHRLSAMPHDDSGRQRGLVRLTAIVTDAAIDPDIGLPSYERGVFRGERSVLLADAISLDMGRGSKPTRGRVRISVSEGLDAAPSLVPGTPITITGWMRPPGEPMNPGPERPPREPICTIHTDGWALVVPASLPDRSLARVTAPLRRAQYALQSGARRVLGLDERGEHADPARALLAALVLGQHDPGYDEAYDPFRRVGLAHLLAISGLHLAILAAAAAWLLRAIGPGWRVEAIGVAAAVAMLLIIVPARTPIVRAGIMVLALLGARALGRRHDPLAVLAWTALAIALWNPYQAFDLGYQLSFGLVAALIALAPRTHAAIFGSRQPIKGVLEQPPPVWRLGVNYAGGTIGQLFSATVLCWAVSLPWIVWRTGLVAPLTVPATIVMTPLVGILLIAAYASLLIGTIAPPLAEPLSLVLHALAEVCLGVVRWFDGLAYSSLEIPPIGPAVAISATAALAATAYAGRRVRWNHVLALNVVVVWTAVEVVYPWTRASIMLQLDTLSIGDGSAHLLRSKDQAMLWDCGSLGPGAGRTTASAVGALRDVPVSTAVLTHANLDHANGLPRAAKELGITWLWTTPQALEAANGSGAMRDIFDDLRAQGVTIHTLTAGDAFSLGDAHATVLWPPANERFNDANSSSLVVRWESRSGHTLLLTGDIGGPALGRMIDTTDPELLRVDVLELPHHGADDDHARRLVALSNARVVIQSAGTKRVRRDPWKDYRTQGLWLVTGRDGAIQVRLEHDGLGVSTIRRGEVLKP